jgi:hypothetical protein
MKRAQTSIHRCPRGRAALASALGANMSVAGELGHFDVAGILQILAANQATGRLRFVANGDEVTLYLKDGLLVLATSARLPLRLGRVLQQRGLLTTRQLHDALRLQEAEGGRRSLGEVIVAQGWVKAEEMADCVHEQCVAMLVRVLSANGGAFTYSPDVEPPVKAPTAPQPAQQALLEALRRVDAFGKLRALLPPIHAPLAVSARVDVTVAAYNEQEKRILTALQAGADSWGQLADLLPIDETTLLTTLIGLRNRGLVVAGEGSRGATIGTNAAPPPDENDLLRLLAPTTAAR